LRRCVARSSMAATLARRTEAGNRRGSSLARGPRRGLHSRAMAQDDTDWDAAQDGAEMLAEGDVDGALRTLTDLVAAQPDNAYAYFYLGSAYFEQTEYAKALKAYVKALELSPEYLGAMVNAGHTLRMLGRHQEAIRMAQQVLARAPSDGDAMYLIGVCCFSRGDDARAVEYLGRFLHTNPELEVAQEVEGMLQLLRERTGGVPN
jgi:tetratricopeptide (TPR) repeat protein